MLQEFAWVRFAHNAAVLEEIASVIVLESFAFIKGPGGFEPAEVRKRFVPAEIPE
jgi:hypothetical protein